MKKKRVMSAIIIVMVVGVIAGFNFIQNQNEFQLSDLALANASTLASGESSTVKCCPDPGDTCTLSTGDILGDQDEYPKDHQC